MLGSSQSVASNDFQCLKDFDFVATVLVRGGGGNGGRSILDGSGISIGQEVVAGANLYRQLPIEVFDQLQN